MSSLLAADSVCLSTGFEILLLKIALSYSIKLMRVMKLSEVFCNSYVCVAVI